MEQPCERNCANCLRKLCTRGIPVFAGHGYTIIEEANHEEKTVR